MKTNALLILLVIFSLNKAISQDLVCLNYQFYNSYYDVIETARTTNTDLVLKNPGLKPNQLKLRVFQDSLIEFPKWFLHKRKGVSAGFKAILINSTSNEVSLSNMDGKITIVRQAFYKNKWKNVKSFNRTPRRVCGNSFMTKRIIKGDSSILFAVPCIDGNIKTKFRLIAYKKNGRTPIYSNEFQGLVSKELVE